VLTARRGLSPRRAFRLDVSAHAIEHPAIALCEERQLGGWGVQIMPILIPGRSVGRAAIDLSPMACEFSLGRVVGGMMSIRVELPARYIHERAVREPNESVAVRPHGPRRGIRGRVPVATNPDHRCSDTACTERVYEPVGCDPALIVRTAWVGESWVTSQEGVDGLAHRLSIKRASRRSDGPGIEHPGARWGWRVPRVTCGAQGD
jgi:hypothetical protein